MNIIIGGGSIKFREFILALKGNDDSVSIYAEPHSVPFDLKSTGEVCFLLPEYEKGERFIPEFQFDLLEQIRKYLDAGNRIYLENYFARNYLHAHAFSKLLFMGKERHLLREIIEYGNKILQARGSRYFPVLRKTDSNDLAVISNAIGTHEIFKEGTYKYPILTRVTEFKGLMISGAMNFSEFDPRFMRPYADWKKFFADLVFETLGKSRSETEKIFEKIYPDTIRPCGGTDPEKAVRRALDWHLKSGIMQKADGTRGMFEMIQSNALSVRANLRTDAELLTGALFAAAGKKYGEERFSAIGRNLADFLLNRGIQTPCGLLKWFDHTDTAYVHDSSRGGLALFNLYRITGEEKYRDAVEKMGQGFLCLLENEHLCAGCFDTKYFENACRGEYPHSVNPAEYAEMVPLLLMLKKKKYLDAALRITDEVGKYFPKFPAFGFSDTHVYPRYLMMIASVQHTGKRDCSEHINRLLAFFEKDQDKCGGIRSREIRMQGDSLEGGVAIGGDADHIADLLYCNNFLFVALSILKKLPLEKRGAIAMEKVNSIYNGLRRFLLRIQIKSDYGALNGGWMRAYDMELDEHFGLDLDMDWGAYCIMGGWVMGYIPLVLLYEDTNDSFFLNDTNHSPESVRENQKNMG